MLTTDSRVTASDPPKNWPARIGRVLGIAALTVLGALVLVDATLYLVALQDKTEHLAARLVNPYLLTASLFVLPLVVGMVGTVYSADGVAKSARLGERPLATRALAVNIGSLIFAVALGALALDAGLSSWPGSI